MTDPTTGGQKATKDAVLGDACPKALLEVAKVYGFGRKKYTRLNYLRGYPWSSSYDAMQRHLLLFWAGHELDGEEKVELLIEQGSTPEDAWAAVLAEVDADDNLLNSGLHHLAHATWHGLCLLAFVIRKIGTDDRP